jgi:hypothetical protein
MDKASGKLTVYFEEPFWVGVFERIEDLFLKVFQHRPKISLTNQICRYM